MHSRPAGRDVMIGGVNQGFVCNASVSARDWLPDSPHVVNLAKNVVRKPPEFCQGDTVSRSIKKMLSLLVLVTCSVAAQHVVAQHDLFEEMTVDGIVFTEHVQAKLKPPSLTAGQTADEQKHVLQGLAGKQEWSRFTRNSVTAPVTIDINTIDSPDGKRIGLSVHSAFILYAKLDALRNQELMEQTFGRPGNSDEAAGVVTQELSKDYLKQLGFESQSQNSASFAYLEMPLLNKVLVRGVIRIEKRERPGAIEFVWRLDSSFNRTEKYLSRWTRLERNPVGKLVEGDSFPYLGCGGFMGVYEIDRQADQLLVESRLLLHEPEEWFAGSNFLRSKLPLSMQENARNFRRKLASSSARE